MPGILNAQAAQEKFHYRGIAPDAALSSFVAHYWVVSWDLRDQGPYEQHVLPYPSVNMTFKTGRCRVVGVPRGRFSEVLVGAGRVFGVRFQPGGFRPLLGAPVSTITDRFIPVESMFGATGRELADAILSADDASAVSIMDGFLARRLGRPDRDAEVVAAMVKRAETGTHLKRVDQLAAEFGLGMRRLQRLFSEYVGVGPKWVLRRFRLHEAAALAASGADLDWAQLAIDLGYSDQSHFTREFTAIVGVPPARYARTQ